MPHFSECFSFDLADAFPRDAELFADFFERSCVAVADAEAKFENFALALVQA